MFFNIFKRKKKKAAKETEALKKSQEIVEPEVPKAPPEPEPPAPEPQIPESPLPEEKIISDPAPEMEFPEEPPLETETPEAPEVFEAPIEAEISSEPEQEEVAEAPAIPEIQEPVEEAVEPEPQISEDTPQEEKLSPEAEVEGEPELEAEPETEVEPLLSPEQEVVDTEPQAKETPAEPQEEETPGEPEPLEAEAVEEEDASTQADVQKTEEPEDADEPQEKQGFFSRLKSGLARTRQVFSSDVDSLFKSGKPITEELFDELEELLVTSDMGMTVAMDMMDRIRSKAKKLSYAEELRAVLKEEIFGLFPETPEQETEPMVTKPHVIMVVGVNGTGKTTTLGKLATRYTREGKKVLLVAADTFRAAAIDQLEIWADRSESDIVKHREGSDPAAVAYDGIAAAVARKVDIVLVDTAGRLHTQKNLMEELKKIKRTIAKKMKGAPHEVLMVLDATTGQNAISQAKIFNEAVELTQLALTKLDGTAKGGIAAAVAGSMNLPIKYIGVGEGIEDLQDFDARKFIDAIFED